MNHLKKKRSFTEDLIIISLWTLLLNMPVVEIAVLFSKYGLELSMAIILIVSYTLFVFCLHIFLAIILGGR
jgi:hypothetical protein